jgi:hypothetical protein
VLASHRHQCALNFVFVSLGRHRSRLSFLRFVKNAQRPEVCSGAGRLQNPTSLVHFKRLVE